MTRQSEQLEREAEETRALLSGTLDELAARITPGQVLDQIIDYARDGPAAEFLRNLGKEIRENPLPVILIGLGIAWLMTSGSRSSRTLIANAADTAARKSAELGAAASAVVTRVADRTREVTGAVAETARPAGPIKVNEAASVEEPDAVSLCDATREEADPRGLAPEGVASIADEEVRPQAHWQHARAVQPLLEDR
jgi:Protein of unknown function (DUF3618)